jgi:hypothetical protein
MCGAQADVRFTPESDIKRDIGECPLWANSGLVQRSKQDLYSITSSTR